jgi:four helix bundle protein
MDETELQTRTRAFASRVRTHVGTLPRGHPDKRLLRAVESLEANCHAAYGAKSPADFVARMGVAKEKAEESLEWLGILGEDGKLVLPGHVAELVTEGKTLVAMMIDAIGAAEERRA